MDLSGGGPDGKSHIFHLAASGYIIGTLTKEGISQGSVSPPSSGEVVDHLHDETIREAVTAGWRPDGRG